MFRDLQEEFFIKFAEFEEKAREVERARAIYRYALDHIPKVGFSRWVGGGRHRSRNTLHYTPKVGVLRGDARAIYLYALDHIPKVGEGGVRCWREGEIETYSKSK